MSMYCPSCGCHIEDGQKFCQDCGRSLTSVNGATEALGISSLPEVPDAAAEEITTVAAIPEPNWAAPTNEEPTTTIAALSSSILAAPPGPDVSATTQITAQSGSDTAIMPAVPGSPTDGPPLVFDGSDDFHEYPREREPFKFKFLFILSIFGAIAVQMTAVADIIDIRTSAPIDGIATGIRTLETLGTNLAVAGFFGAAVMTLGGLLACFGFRWGAGLAGGAGLALTGWAALVIGLAELRIANAESITRQTTDIFFTLKVTRDLGFWLVVAVAITGVFVFVTSLRSFGTGGWPPLNPWIAAVGAVAGVILSVGPLLPEGNATISNNFRSPTTVLDLPTTYFMGRLLQLALIAFTIVIGLLIVRAYGLGLAAGGVSVALWMWISSLAGIGAFPLGVAAGNFGAGDTTPHAVTTVGMVLTLLMLVIAAVLATIGFQRVRRNNNLSNISPHASRRVENSNTFSN